jgi:hypothetical protein
VDLNGDRKLDVITGHYWPGDIFVFYGEANGEFAKMDNLKDETGRNLNAGEPWTSENEYRMDSLAAAPYAADFDGNADYDMLIGNIEGTVILMENIGGPSEPVFSTKRKKLEAGGKQIQVPQGDAGPVYEDWDHDGVRDLVVGAGDGSVWFYKNIGTKDAPEFAEGSQLVPASSWDPFPNGGVPEKPGVRTKVCVTDYNGDGLVDLLLGDFILEKAATLELSEEQIKRRDELHAKRQELLNQFQQAANDEKRQQELGTQFTELYTELSKYESRDIQHGFVWLYLREAAEN